MVIISTNAMEASIHAVSPELIFEVSISSGLVGAGGAAAAGAAAGATAAAGADGAAFSWAIAEAFRLAATSMASTTNSFLTMILPLERCGAGLAGADTDDLSKIKDEDLSVPDLIRFGRFFDCLNDPIEQIVLNRDLDFHFGQKVNLVFRTTIQLGVPFLPTEALHFRGGNALHANGGQRFPYLVKLVRSDNGGYQFHEGPPLRLEAGPAKTARYLPTMRLISFWPRPGRRSNV